MCAWERDTEKDKEREGETGREGGREGWWVDERRRGIGCGAQQNPTLCYLSKMLYSTLTTMISFNSVLLRCISQTRGLWDVLPSKSNSGTTASALFYLFSCSFSSCFSSQAQTGNMWGQVWVSVTGVLVIFSCKAESLEDCILGETLFDSCRHLVCRHCLGIRLIKGRASRMKVSWATVPGLLWERKREKQRERTVVRMIHALK